jgi:hypothetical protein
MSRYTDELLPPMLLPRWSIRSHPAATRSRLASRTVLLQSEVRSRRSFVPMKHSIVSERVTSAIAHPTSFARLGSSVSRTPLSQSRLLPRFRLLGLGHRLVPRTLWPCEP